MKNTITPLKDTNIFYTLSTLISFFLPKSVFCVKLKNMVWKNGKILFESPRHAHQVQTALFEAGFTWENGKQNYKSDLFAVHWSEDCMNIWSIGNEQVYKYAGIERTTVLQPIYTPKPHTERKKSHHYLTTQRNELKVILEEATKYLIANGLNYPENHREAVTETGKLKRRQFAAMLSFCVQAVKGSNISPTYQLDYIRKIKIQFDSRVYYELRHNWEVYRPKGKAFEQETLIENLKHLTCTTK